MLDKGFFYILEIVGTIAFALSGAMVSIERRLDLFGVLLLGVVTALGGGVLRDVMMGSFPPMAFLNIDYFLFAIGASISMFLIAYFLKDTYFNKAGLIESINNIFDAVGLGVFAVSGVRIALEFGYGDNGFLCVFLGMLTAIGGGVLRDMMSLRIPFVLRKRIYAVAALAGAITYYILTFTAVNDGAAALIGVGLTCLIRVLATTFRWDLPVAKPLEAVYGEKRK